MFRLRRIGIDTLSQHVVFLHEAAVQQGELRRSAVVPRQLERVRLQGRPAPRRLRPPLRGRPVFA